MRRLGAKKVRLRKNLYVGNLSSTDDQELERLLSQFGIVKYAAVVAGEGEQPGASFGVVEMQTDDEAEAAIKALSGSGFCGRVLDVRWATPAEQTACGHPAMFGAMNISNPS
jgi:RNA recognition motif-containing protein